MTAGRHVLHYQTWTEAQADARNREACTVFDVHYRFWSVPTELTLREIEAQIHAACLADSIEQVGSVHVIPIRPDAELPGQLSIDEVGA